MTRLVGTSNFNSAINIRKYKIKESSIMLLIYYAQQLHSNWWLLEKFYLDSSLTYLSALSMIYKHHFISNPTSQLPAAVFRPPSDGGLMILPETFCDVIVEAITHLFFIFLFFFFTFCLYCLFAFLFLFFKRSARFKRNFRHNCMPVLGLA